MNIKFQHPKLRAAARKAAKQSYSPYSHFRVGAVVLAASNKIYSGCNVENASFGLTLCAERTALATAIAAGETKIKAIAIACIDGDAALGLRAKVPCGACRQWIQELAPDAEILIDGHASTFKIGDFLPIPFDPEQL